MLIRPIRVPDTVDHPAIADLEAVVTISTEERRIMRGDNATRPMIDATLASWRDRRDQLSMGWLAEVDGRCAGIAGAALPQADDARTVSFDVIVREPYRRRGIATRLFREVEAAAIDAGRTVLRVGTMHLPQAGDRVSAATGFGSVPLDAASSFARNNGFRLEQVYRESSLDIDDHLELIVRRHGDARPSVRGRYDHVWWEIPTPPGELDDYAALIAQSELDVPLGGTVLDNGPWDAARLLRNETADLEAGRRRLVGAIRDRVSGQLVAVNDLVVEPSNHAVAHQDLTMVQREHRGRRLGWWVKCATYLSLHEQMPGVRRIVTSNAEENTPMLRINDALGFTPALFQGAWQRSMT